MPIENRIGDEHRSTVSVRRRGVALLAAALIGLTGCGHSGDKNGQVVATVDDNEITVLQLNRLLRQAGADPSEKKPVRMALDSLIDQDLLLQEALKGKMDRDPEVVQALDAARRQILADTYAERMIYPQTPIGESEEEDYYKNHPHLFSERKVYQVETFNLEGPAPDAELRSELDNAHNADEVERVLKHRNAKFERQSVVRAAEQIPLEMLEQFASASRGDIIVAPDTEGRTVLMQINETLGRPLSMEQARPYIHQFLVAGRNRDAMQARVKELRAKAKVVYLGAFAESDETAAAQPTPAGDGKTAAPVEQRDGYLEKGLSGLK